MSQTSRKPIHTLLLAGYMAGMGAILFAVALPVSEWLGQTFSLGDDWSLLTLPASILIGIILRVRSGTKLWLQVFSAIMLASYIALMGSLVVHQIASPKQGLGAGIGHMIGCWLLMHLTLFSLVCVMAAVVTNRLLDCLDRMRSKWSS